MNSFISIILRVCLLIELGAGSLWALEFQRYHSQDEIASYLREQAQQHPDLVRFQVIGRSRQGREIAVLTISKNFASDTPAMYFNGTHHGNEKISTEAVLGLIKHLIQHRDQADTDRLLRRYKFLLHPLVNPDGHALNLRSDARGVDPNRDYPTPNQPESEAFQIVETRLVRDLLGRENVIASAAFHSGLEAVLWPWCHSPASSRDDPVFKTIGEAVARSMNVPKFTQSYFDYQTEGEFIDYAYMRFGIYALTIEVATEPTPKEEQLESLVQRSVLGSLSFANAIDQLPLKDSKAAALIRRPLDLRAAL